MVIVVALIVVVIVVVAARVVARFFEWRCGGGGRRHGFCFCCHQVLRIMCLSRVFFFLGRLLCLPSRLEKWVRIVVNFNAMLGDGSDVLEADVTAWFGAVQLAIVNVFMTFKSLLVVEFLGAAGTGEDFHCLWL